MRVAWAAGWLAGWSACARWRRRWPTTTTYIAVVVTLIAAVQLASMVVRHA